MLYSDLIMFCGLDFDADREYAIRCLFNIWHSQFITDALCGPTRSLGRCD